MNENYKLKFIPHLKQGLSVNAAFIPNEGRFQKKLTVKLTSSGDETPVEHAIRLRGPQDVIGVHSTAFARIFPVPGTNDFESNLFPFVEFKEPDFPWRFSLQKERNDRLLPWLTLIVLESDQYVLEKIKLPDGQEVIKMTVDKKHVKLLPDVTSAWAWAHVQLSCEAEEDKIYEAFKNEPELNCSRIVCPRKLIENTAYTAFLVPVYEIGRIAGLGMTFENKGIDGKPTAIESNILKPWSSKDKDLFSLPVYYKWNFQTGEGGDFETLVKKIDPVECPAGVGQREIDGSKMTYIDVEDENGLNFTLEGVLLPFTYDGHAEDSPECMKKMHTELNKTINIQENNGEDPFVNIPLYGEFYTDAIKELIGLNLNDYKPHNWAQEINIKRGYRTIASMGTDVIVKNQDKYMKLCWEQVGAIKEANEEIRRAQVGKILNKGIQKKHMDKLSDREFTAVTRSFHHYYGYENSHFKNYLDNAGLPAGLTSNAGRRVFQQRQKIKGDVKNIFEKFLDLGTLQSVRKTLLKTPLKTEAVTIDLNEKVISNAYRKQFNPEADIINRLNKMLTMGNKAFLNKLAPIMLAPEIPIPMYQYLVDLNVEYLIPNLKLIENNCITLLIENRRFLESYMLGLNHEMIRELVWREFPTDKKGTIFKYFWDSLNPKEKESDIKNIHEWRMEDFGNNRQVMTQDISMILGVKADLIRRYPDAQFHVIIDDAANINNNEYWKNYLANFEEKLDDSRYDKKIFSPEFFALLGTDTLFLGFPQKELSLKKDPSERIKKVEKFYFVISEISFLPRFGLDLGTPGDTVYDFSWGNVEVDANNQYIKPLSEKAELPKVNNHPLWDKNNCNSAKIARHTMQLPVRIIIPAKLLIPAEKK